MEDREMNQKGERVAISRTKRGRKKGGTTAAKRKPIPIVLPGTKHRGDQRS